MLNIVYLAFFNRKINYVGTHLCISPQTRTQKHIILTPPNTQAKKALKHLSHAMLMWSSVYKLVRQFPIIPCAFKSTYHEKHFQKGSFEKIIQITSDTKINSKQKNGN